MKDDIHIIQVSSLEIFVAGDAVGFVLDLLVLVYRPGYRMVRFSPIGCLRDRFGTQISQGFHHFDSSLAPAALCGILSQKCQDGSLLRPSDIGFGDLFAEMVAQSPHHTYP